MWLKISVYFNLSPTGVCSPDPAKQGHAAGMKSEGLRAVTDFRVAADGWIARGLLRIPQRSIFSKTCL